jgi:hypothetical protein
MEMGRQLCMAAKANGDSTVPRGEAMCRNIRRWESGHGGVSERYMLHYCKALSISPQMFGPALRPEDEPVTGKSAPPHQAGPAIPGGEFLEPGDMNWREFLRAFSTAGALLAAREFLAATAELVTPDTPPDELLRYLTQYRAHLSALAAGCPAPAEPERGPAR